jgi:Holliday junction resolvase RusA-like endonuclease
VFALAASEAWTKPPHGGVVALELTFRFVRPRSHYTAKGLLRAGVPLAPPRPDLDKLVRGACDAMTGVVYVDDSLVGCIWAAKEYGDRDETLRFRGDLIVKRSLRMGELTPPYRGVY